MPKIDNGKMIEILIILSLVHIAITVWSISWNKDNHVEVTSTIQSIDETLNSWEIIE